MTELNDPITIIKKTIERKKRKLKTIIVVVMRFKHILHYINVNGRIILGSCYNNQLLFQIYLSLQTMKAILTFHPDYFKQIVTPNNQEDLTNVAIVLFILLFSSPYFITIC